MGLQIKTSSKDTTDSSVHCSFEKRSNVGHDSHDSKMAFEKYRIESFKHWPLPYICVRKLAADGFYYTGYDDAVECRFSRLKLHHWEAEDDARHEHVRYAPYCPFIRRLEMENIILNKNSKNN